MKSTLATFALALAACTAQAGTFDGWRLNGNAYLMDTGDTLRLAENNYQAGSAWAPGQISLAHDFSVAFSFQIAGGTGADGITFTIQNSAAGASALGANGGGLGYEGVNTSVAFLYDTWENNYDTDRTAGPNTSVAFGGGLNVWSGATVGQAYALRDQVLYSWVDYSAATNTYSMYINDTDVKPLTAQETLDGALSDLSGGGMAYIGFTGATGGSIDNHDILSVSISAVPEADAGLLALAGLPMAWAILRKRRKAGA